MSRRDTHTRLVFPFNSGCLVDFFEYLAGLAVYSVSPVSRIVRESPPVSIHAETSIKWLSEKVRESPPVSFQAETSSNVSDWRVGAKFSLSFQVHHHESQLVRNSPFSLKYLVYASCFSTSVGGLGAVALGHTGSLPGCAEHGLLFPEGGKVVV